MAIENATRYHIDTTRLLPYNRRGNVPLGRRLAVAAPLCCFLLILVRSGRAGSDQPPASASKFVGAQACAACHRQLYETWLSGRHSKMLQRATAASVVGDFSKGGVTLNGNSFQERRVEYTLGNRRIQHFLTTIDNGSIVVLPRSRGKRSCADSERSTVSNANANDVRAEGASATSPT